MSGSKKQGCVSHSTTEAELVAADVALRTAGLPAMTLWESYAGRKTSLFFHEDNKAMLDIIRTGRNPMLRFLSRTHGVSVKWLHEVYMRDDVHAQYMVTSLMAADIFTKGFTDARIWTSLCEQINVAPLRRFDDEDLQGVHHMFKNDTLNRSKRNRNDGVARMPPGCESWGSKAGWHDADPCYYVVKEPRNYRLPPKSMRDKFTWRSTWLQKYGEWELVERNSRVNELADPEVPILVLVQKAAFIFSNERIPHKEVQPACAAVMLVRGVSGRRRESKGSRACERGEMGVHRCHFHSQLAIRAASAPRQPQRAAPW